MSKELQLWQFIASRLNEGESVMLLVVAESSGSSPGRAGYKMAVAANGELSGSIGGGVMEVNLVKQSRAFLSETGATANGFRRSTLIEQVHQKNAPNSSGMICSGRQTVILKPLSAGDAVTVNKIVQSMEKHRTIAVKISNLRFQIVAATRGASRYFVSKTGEGDFVYQETLGPGNKLTIIGGGHCALALSELMSRLDFHIRIFDDRPDLNTIAKNEFADEVTIIDSYEKIGEYVRSDEAPYVVVMTLGYASDAVAIRQLVDQEFKYFGVLGSKAKMATLMRELSAEGLDKERLSRICTPIGLPINSRTPEEIAISIGAEIVAVKNRSEPPA
jgi:xanthine dehydrogenase accessory factor